VLGVSAVLKGWPLGIGLVLLQRGLRRRRESVVAFVLTILVAPILIVAVAGGSGLADFFRNNFDARTQPLTSDSVWGVPKLLFSRSGIGRPLFVSPFVRFGVTAILVVWVIGLVVVALRTAGDPSMCLWNVTLCVVMLQPVAHTTYALYGLPILWLWTARVLTRSPSWSSREVAAALTLFAWWAINTRAWPGADPLAVVSAARYCVVFGANLAACTVSVACARSTTRDAQSRVMSAVSSPSSSIVV
jgi:hypothetical protein